MVFMPNFLVKVYKKTHFFMTVSLYKFLFYMIFDVKVIIVTVFVIIYERVHKHCLIFLLLQIFFMGDAKKIYSV